jgi:hypothetical protein
VPWLHVSAEVVVGPIEDQKDVLRIFHQQKLVPRPELTEVVNCVTGQQPLQPPIFKSPARRSHRSGEGPDDR